MADQGAAHRPHQRPWGRLTWYAIALVSIWALILMACYVLFEMGFTDEAGESRPGTLQPR